MKPRRTFHSVVTELIGGLTSGEIVLDKNTEKPPSIFISHHFDDAQLVGFDDAHKAFQFHRGSFEQTWQLHERLESHIFPFLRDVKKREVVKTDLEKNVARAKDRIWFLVGGWPHYSVTRDILTASFLAKVPHLGRPTISPAQHEIRIVVTEMKNWDQWQTLFSSQGLAGNVRVVNAHLDGWLVFADHNLFVDVPKMDEKHIDNDPLAKELYKNYPRGMFVVEEGSDPDEFHHLEQLFDELWKHSSDTGMAKASP